MKESITKFDLEAAFKALDEIETPKAKKGINANKPALTEIFSRKSKFDVLFEEYYDISSTEELGDAKEAREAEVAKAKLARIEKIVDLDADSPDDLLTSYVGKYIMQCPQCMTLFYKDKEDIEESEDDENTVNVNEICQHCGNESGYTLIGKVGEAEPEEEMPAEQEKFDDLNLDIEDDSEETSEDDTSSTDDESNFDLDGELDELDFEIEDDETEDKKEEAFYNNNENDYLVEQVEQLTEDKFLDISDSEFEELINSPEFKKPISDNSTRVMLRALSDDEAVNEDLEEGIFDKIKDRVKDGVKDKVSSTLSKITDKLASREDKADWILANAKNNYNDVKVDDEGKPVYEEGNQRFGAFLVIRYTNKYSNGKEITMAPSEDNKDLVPGENKPQIAKNYKSAESLAKGWSMQDGNGPAFVFLAKDEKDTKPVFLCEYFKGELEAKNDKLESYFKSVKKSLDGAKLRAKGGDETFNKQTTAASVKTGMKIALGEEAVEITSVEKSAFGNGGLDLEVKFADGATKTFSVSPDTKITLLSAKEEAFNLNSIMNNLEELQESSIETLISQALIESYANVAGFRLKGCKYLNEQLSLDGTIFFTSGNTRETTYIFSEAYKNKSDEIILTGLNEKLGLDKQFTITGKADNKVFIAESFKLTK